MACGLLQTERPRPAPARRIGVAIVSHPKCVSSTPRGDSAHPLNAAPPVSTDRRGAVAHAMRSRGVPPTPVGRRTSHSLLYTSRKLIPPERDALELADIVSVAQTHNAAVGITGGLIDTRRAFAQLLEGPAQAIDELMAKIVADRRHEAVQIVRSVTVTRRKFPFWTMAYSGPFAFVDAHVEPLVDAGCDIAPQKIDQLENLIVQFAIKNGRAPTVSR